MCQLQGTQAQPVAPAASCPFYHATVPAAPRSSLPSGCRRVCCHSQRPAKAEILPRQRGVRVGMYRESTADVSKHREEMCLATPLMKTVTAASTIVRHGDKHNLKAKQCNIVPRKCTVPGVEGKHATTCVSQKEKPWRKYNGSGYFASYSSIPMALKT